jgi:hypothetical protein
MCDDHPWKLTAPWWRWPRAGEPGDPRATPPVLQMYDSSDPVSVFVKNPQDALAFGDQDRVQLLHAVTGGTEPGMFRAEPGETRKVFLPTHKRFYLVVCELHCDRPGLPSVRRDKACQVGMVVRRRRLRFASGGAAEAARLVAESGRIQAAVARIDRQEGRRVLAKRHRLAGAGVVTAFAGAAVQAAAPIGEVLRGERRKRRETLLGELAGVRAELAKWQQAAGAHTVSEGWMPSESENVGAWQPVPEGPEEVVEQVFPLHPLIPDPRDPAHHGAGKTLYFGLLPTGGRDMDEQGRPRWDTNSLYEVRCFVRRHRCGCPRTDEPNDCGGELVWSEPTEGYRLAGHFDPVGTGNQAVDIQLPDFRELSASLGTRLPVSMTAPPGSSLVFSNEKEIPTDGSVAESSQICFFSIPLITIVATFVLKIFLPIVVFIFGLWWMLSLRFCIPPSISFAGGIDADLDVKLPELDLQLQVELSVAVPNFPRAGQLAARKLNLLTEGQERLAPGVSPPVVNAGVGLTMLGELGAEGTASVGAAAYVGEEPPAIPLPPKQPIVAREEVFA